MANVLKLSKTDFHFEQNNVQHKTNKFGKERLIIRRGKEISITLHFDGRNYDKETDKITFIVKTGVTDIGPMIEFELADQLRKNEWSASVHKNSGSELSVIILPPANSIIGHYSLKCKISSDGKSATAQMGKFVLLFNPWCEDDDVFMDNKLDLKEYVQSDQGLLYQGVKMFIKTLAWHFGQYDKDILDICLAILDQSNNFLANPAKDYSKRNKPVYVSRVVTAMMNSEDDKGILLGRWSSTYPDGVNPLTWNGSTSILQQWHESGFQAVRYGQCWVFSAVACTVFRCLGIPSRPITNFNSAHDTNANLEIDCIVDMKGKKIPGASRDTIWNFHCWTECWMKRRDLKPEFDGWQVLDATPQEKSEGIYCCGPTSIKAIKNGHINEKYETKFVFSEVNADYVTWCLLENKSLKKIKVNTYLVGQNISTKAVKKDDRVDITMNYKYPEGSSEELQTYNIARIERINIEPADKEMYLKVITPIIITNGSDLDIEIYLSNKTAKEKYCNIMITAHTILYNGEILKKCGKKTESNLLIGPKKDMIFNLKVLYNEYSKSISAQLLIMISVAAVDENNDMFTTRKVISLKNPKMGIQVTIALKYED
ncbi:protein-glutamine gamma-glutamyltransferase 2-like [Callorhinchus milii]|uniref:protein-glutamine gamma-glutamyltransferase 2-like n=1 Tax=Callorhinchus milii TaxID=7868 RepID=UPI001C3FAA73|nr:protein-glutamine gamma-glutamyltransferase 2-like [Callorhinchus milii]